MKFHFLLFPIMLIAGFYFLHNTIFKNREEEIQKILQKMGEKQDILKLYTQKLALEAELNQLVKGFPNQVDFKWLMEGISSITGKEEIEIISIQPQPIKSSEFYREVSIALELEGSYHQIGRMVEAIDNSEYFLQVKKLKLKPKKLQAEGKETQVKAKDGHTLLECSVEVFTIVPSS